MKVDIKNRMPEVYEALNSTDNPRHIAILNNFIRHANLELCGLWEGIVAPDMMVEHPVYRFHSPAGLRVLDGMDAVKAEYQGYAEEGSAVIYHTDGIMSVTDNGILTEYVSHRFWPGHLLRAQNDDIDDPSAVYLVSMTQAMYWPYDDQARVREERVYRGSDRKIKKCKLEEVITTQECREKLLPGLPSVHDPLTGKPRPTSHYTVPSEYAGQTVSES